MLRGTVLTVVVLGLSASLTLTQRVAAQPARLSVAQIVDRNIAARGGLQRWRGVQTLSWAGKMEAGGNDPRAAGVPGLPKPAKQAVAAELKEQPQLPFRWDMMRGRKSRLEIDFAGNTAVQVFDGSQGWKLRPFLNRHEVESYTADELKSTQAQTDLDGALVDYAAKGTKIDLVGVEKVEGKDAYKLQLTLANKYVLNEWIDAQSFLEVKLEGTPRKLDGKPHAVTVFLRDYRTVDGLVIPHVIETVVEGVARTEKIHIDKVAVNPRIDATRFTKPT